MDVQFSSSRAQSNPTASDQKEDSVRGVPRIEPCEFEVLLQRAMEILNARDLKIELESKPS